MEAFKMNSTESENKKLINQKNRILKEKKKDNHNQRLPS